MWKGLHYTTKIIYSHFQEPQVHNEINMVAGGGWFKEGFVSPLLQKHHIIVT